MNIVNGEQLYLFEMKFINMNSFIHQLPYLQYCTKTNDTKNDTDFDLNNIHTH